MDEKEILSHFDKLFNTDVKQYIRLNMPLIKFILENLYEMPSRPSTTYQKSLKKQIDLENELVSRLQVNEVKIFYEYKKILMQTNKIEDEQLFCFGYIFAKELEREGKI